MFKRKTDNGKMGKQQVSQYIENLEDTLLEAGVSPLICSKLSDAIRAIEPETPQKFKEVTILNIESIIRSTRIQPPSEGRGCWLFLGVNGVGKTTNLVKLANYWLQRSDCPIVCAAGDTFRAAAIEQLEVHAKRLKIRCIRQKQGGSSAAVIYDAIESIDNRKGGLVLADTAGRMHTKTQLVQELMKIDRVIRSKINCDAYPKAYRKILVIDATTGLNALQQAETFNEALGIDGIILSKFDSGAGGGLALNISDNLGIPFAYLGTGEQYSDIQPFEPRIVADRIIEAMNN